MRHTPILFLPVAVVLALPSAVAATDVTGPAPTREHVLARLTSLTSSSQFLFGQQNATLWGMYLDGKLVSTNTWFESTARAGRFTSDSAAIVGDDPAVLGVSLDMLAFEPPEWNRTVAAAAAVKRQFERGGLVTTEWHAPSCGAVDVRVGAPLSSEQIDGRTVVVRAVEGGTSFYAEEEYHRPIVSRADVPESLRCLCEIANNVPIGAGVYRGVSAKDWLIAHAKRAARALREHGLADLPIIVRPFHEHNGSWFWWGQPYWNCAALLDQPDALSGADAYKEMVRIFVTALRNEPGMSNLLFAYSSDKLQGPREAGPQPAPKRTMKKRIAAQNKLSDPTGYARDLLRQRLVGELRAAGLAFDSPAHKAATVRASEATTAKRARVYVAQRRRYYAEAYAGDDVFDVLGIDLYHPMDRAANADDRWSFRLQLRAVAEEAKARGKPHALTEAGTYRLQLAKLASDMTLDQPLLIHGKATVDEGLARLFDPADRTRLLANFGLNAAGDVVLSVAERRAVLSKVASEDWFNDQLLVLAKEAHVSYALVWQTYFEKQWTDRYFYYFVPYPGHPTVPAFQRFYDDRATCFLRDGCPSAGSYAAH